MKRALKIIVLLTSLSVYNFAQTETLTNAVVIEMTKAGLGREIVLKKIEDSKNRFDTSANALIELKKAGVADEVIAAMLEKATPPGETPAEPASDQKNETAPGYSENLPALEAGRFVPPQIVGAKEALLNAKSVALEKSSLHPSRQALEKALLKSKSWQKYDLAIIRYKQDADIYIEIGRVPLSWITHRYVFRIYDRRSGTVVTAGETTSWGNLAENLAREITQKMDAVAAQ